MHYPTKDELYRLWNGVIRNSTRPRNQLPALAGITYLCHSDNEKIDGPFIPARAGLHALVVYDTVIGEGRRAPTTTNVLGWRLRVDAEGTLLCDESGLLYQNNLSVFGDISPTTCGFRLYKALTLDDRRAVAGGVRQRIGQLYYQRAHGGTMDRTKLDALRAKEQKLVSALPPLPEVVYAFDRNVDITSFIASPGFQRMVVEAAACCADLVPTAIMRAVDEQETDNPVAAYGVLARRLPEDTLLALIDRVLLRLSPAGELMHIPADAVGPELRAMPHEVKFDVRDILDSACSWRSGYFVWDVGAHQEGLELVSARANINFRAPPVKAVMPAPQAPDNVPGLITVDDGYGRKIAVLSD